MIATLSNGILKNKNINLFLGEKLYYFNPTKKYDYIITWGKKETSKRAEKVSKNKGIPLIRLEDGFIRSLMPGVYGTESHSIIKDYSGIYYDSSNGNDLLTMIKNNDISNMDIERSFNIISLIKKYGISKYNNHTEIPSEYSTRNDNILIIDQTAGDASLRYGNFNPNEVHKMLNDAISDNKGRRIFIKTHPDVLSGKKKGLFSNITLPPEVKFLEGNPDPRELFKHTKKVYTATSQMGFEATLYDVETHCYGTPFYSGWGFTIDKKHIQRPSRSKEAVFFFSYVKYCNYINPYTKTACEIEDTIFLLSKQKEHFLKYHNFRGLGVGFSPWKKRFIKNIFPKIKFTSKSLEEIDAPNVVWSSQASFTEKNSIYIEDGFIRSYGLGANLVPPLSLAIDSCGIYYNKNIPSDLENILNNIALTPPEIALAKKIRNFIVDHNLTKYNVGKRTLSHETVSILEHQTKKIILVVGQVETDASLKYGGFNIQDNSSLLKRVREDNPNAFIIYKPHPDIVAGARKGALSSKDKSLYDLSLHNEDIIPILPYCNSLHTMTSLSGFEALIRGIPVFTYGAPFYSGWGLTNDICELIPRRKRKLTIDELIFGCIIAYPTYLTYDNDICDAQTSLSLIEQKIKTSKPCDASLKIKLIRFFQRILNKELK